MRAAYAVTVISLLLRFDNRTLCRLFRRASIYFKAFLRLVNEVNTPNKAISSRFVESDGCCLPRPLSTAQFEVFTLTPVLHLALFLARAIGYHWTIAS